MLACSSDYRQNRSVVQFSPNRLTEASARSRLASISLRVNDLPQALEHGQVATRLFAEFKDDPSSREFSITNSIALAEVHLANGNNAEARRLLADFETANGQTVYSSLALHRVRSLTYDRSKEPARALTSLQAAAAIAERSTRELQDASARLRWKQEAGPVFQTLARLLLDAGDAEQALAKWEWFRSAPIWPRRGLPPLRDTSTALRSALARFGEASVVSWLEVDGRLGIWLYDDRGVHLVWSPAPADQCRRAASEFARLCSRRDSDLRRLRNVASELYNMLFGPVEHLLDPRRTLLLEPDSTPGAIAFEALVRPDGQWLGEPFTVIIAPGLWAEIALRPEQTPITRAMQALIVGNPVHGVDSILPPLPDAEREAYFVSGVLPSNKLLVGSQATAGAVQAALPRAEIFHFAGHARFDGESVRLLLSGANDLLDADSIEKLARRCRLAVLSACSTGAAVVAVPGASTAWSRHSGRAGSPEIIASRWDVDSTASAQLFADFYTQLLRGEPTSSALRIAARSLRSRVETSHPYFWAPFALFGSAPQHNLSITTPGASNEKSTL